MMLFEKVRKNSASLRWRLPVSYAAIALLATLLLGLLLLTILRGFYRQQELEFLTSNARVISDEVSYLVAGGDKSGLQAQAAGFSFLTQTRVEILDGDQEGLLADSGERGEFTADSAITFDAVLDATGNLIGNETAEEIIIDGPGGSQIVVEDAGGIKVETIIVEEIEDVSTQANTQVVTRSTSLEARGTPLGFELTPGDETTSELSNLTVVFPILSSIGEPLGFVRLSQGPAYGASILRSVGRGWVLASLLAVLLAALAGWWFSRRLTQPLLNLTYTTEQMANGDLGARATDSGRDEVGMLSRSFNDMAEKVETTVESLRYFVADAAHEIQTPLTALQTDLQLLVDHTQDEAGRRRAKRALSQAQRLEELGDGLLELSRIESGESGTERSQIVSLNLLLLQAAEDWASRAEQSRLRFQLELPQVELRIFGNAALVRQAIDNLVGNALKFTPALGEVTVSLRQADNRAEIEVSDNGIGIPSHDQALLFNRFHRGQNASEFPGSGLGLAIAQAIAISHGGEIRIHSDDHSTRAVLSIALTKQIS